jgi:hypothetical protein
MHIQTDQITNVADAWLDDAVIFGMINSMKTCFSNPDLTIYRIKVSKCMSKGPL